MSTHPLSKKKSKTNKIPKDYYIIPLKKPFLIENMFRSSNVKPKKLNLS